VFELRGIKNFDFEFRMVIRVYVYRQRRQTSCCTISVPNQVPLASPASPSPRRLECRPPAPAQQDAFDMFSYFPFSIVAWLIGRSSSSTASQQVCCVIIIITGFVQRSGVLARTILRLFSTVDVYVCTILTAWIGWWNFLFQLTLPELRPLLILTKSNCAI
jgi:VanZ family protein